MAYVLKPLSHITSASPETLRIDLITVLVRGRNLGTSRLWAWLLPTVKCRLLTPPAAHVLVFISIGYSKVFLHTLRHLLGSLFGINQAASSFACGLS